MPLAIVRGRPILEIPEDLYIPPDALEVILDAFEGPLDLLLYLIRRQNLDILDIPVAEITRQYVEYIELMRDFRLTLAAEYLVMAAVLAEIKSRLLLPRPVEAPRETEADPRAELVRRLLEYERFKKAAEKLDALPRLERDTAIATAAVDDRRVIRLPPPVDLREILLALAGSCDAPNLLGIIGLSAKRSRCVSAWEKCSRRSATVGFTASKNCFRLPKVGVGWSPPSSPSSSLPVNNSSNWCRNDPSHRFISDRSPSRASP